MRKALPKELRDVIEHNNNLSRYLLSLNQEQDFTDRSWLYENEDPESVLSRWKEQLSALESGSVFEREIFQFDTSQEKKWGPQGGHEAMEELFESIIQPQFEGQPHPSAFSTETWQRAKANTIAKFKAAGVGALRPAAYDKVIDNMRARDTLESNSGWPSFARRNVEDVKQLAIQDAMNGRWKTYPAIALFRRYNNKTRLVWMYPMSVNLVEASFFQPLQTAILKADSLAKGFFAPWVGFEQVRASITEEYQSGNFVSASDFSATDQHFRLATSLEVFDVLSELFLPQYREPLKESIQCMHNIPLVISQTEYVVGEHGVASGSNWTNFIETVFDYILSEYVTLLSEEQHRPRWEGLFGIGDDMAWTCNEYDPTFNDWLANVGTNVGQEINAEKVTNDRDKVKSLQRLFQRGYRRQDMQLRGVYSTIRALKSSVYPEKFHNPKLWSSDMFCARQFMILENCVDHPLFEDFVKFICAGQKDLIPFSKLSRKELDRINRETKLLPGLNTTYNQERRESSFADFASVRIASRL